MSLVSESNARILSKFWHPLLFEKDLPKEKIISAELISKKLVIYRTLNSIVIAEDRCPHRGTSLSLGSVVQGKLICAYHGLQFGTSGKCQTATLAYSGYSRNKLCLTTFPYKVRYGIIWTCLNPVSNHDIPEFLEYSDPSYSSLSLAPLEWKASPIRQIESVFDLTHFSYVHRAPGCSMLGSAELMPPYKIKTRPYLIDIDFRSSSRDEYGFWARTYRITLPFTVQMSAKRTPTGFWTIFNSVCPVSETQSRIFVIQAFNFNRRQNKKFMGAYEEIVYKEDQTVVESQSPAIPNLKFRDECLLPEDRISIAYRKALRRIGLADTACSI